MVDVESVLTKLARLDSLLVLRLRNLLVHDYGDIDHRRLWQSLGELDDLRSFAAAAQKAAEDG